MGRPRWVGKPAGHTDADELEGRSRGALRGSLRTQRYAVSTVRRDNRFLRLCPHARDAQKVVSGTQ